jgi:hypothetical protein
MSKFIEVNCQGAGCAHLIPVDAIAIVHQVQPDDGCIIQLHTRQKFPVRQTYAHITADILRVTESGTPMTRLN